MLERWRKELVHCWWGWKSVLCHSGEPVGRRLKGEGLDGQWTPSFPLLRRAAFEHINRGACLEMRVWCASSKLLVLPPSMSFPRLKSGFISVFPTTAGLDLTAVQEGLRLHKRTACRQQQLTGLAPLPGPGESKCQSGVSWRGRLHHLKIIFGVFRGWWVET